MNIAVVDDHKLFAQMLKHTLERLMPQSHIVLYFGAEQFFTDSAIYDLVILDILLPGTINGIGVMEKAKQTDGGKTKYMLLTAVAELEMLKLAVRAGANAYLTKETSEDEFIEAITSVQAGNDDPYIQKALRQKLITNLLLAEDERPVSLLTKGEQEIVNFLCNGKTPKEIATEKNLSINTVNQYLKILKRKFKVHRTTEIVLFAIEQGLYKR